MYPVDEVRSTFNIKSRSQDDVILGVQQANTCAAVEQFLFDNVDFTKQHIHLFQLSKRFNISNFDKNQFPFKVIKEVGKPGELILFCLPIVNYDLVTINPYAQYTLDFYQPLKIVIKGKTLAIHFTVLEKRPDSYIPSGSLVKSERLVEEEQLKADVLNYFDAEGYGPTVLVIDKGVKDLWNNHLIDSKYVRFKKSDSTATDAMDKGRTFRKSYPAEYTALVSRPLEKTIFAYQNSDDIMCDVFVVDPSIGLISITHYPKTKNQIQNVIDTILSKN